MAGEKWKINCPVCGEPYESYTTGARADDLRKLVLPGMDEDPFLLMNHIHNQHGQTSRPDRYYVSYRLGQETICRLCGKECGWFVEAEAAHLRKFHKPKELVSLMILATMG